MSYNKVFEEAHKVGAREFGFNWIEANSAVIDIAENFGLNDVLSGLKYKALLSEIALAVLKSQRYKYLILSGEGGFRTEHSFLMECDTLEEAKEHIDDFKSGEYSETQLFIFKAIKVTEK